jgi:hypothetical protein
MQIANGGKPYFLAFEKPGVKEMGCEKEQLKTLVAN